MRAQEGQTSNFHFLLIQHFEYTSQLHIICEVRNYLKKMEDCGHNILFPFLFQMYFISIKSLEF